MHDIQSNTEYEVQGALFGEPTLLPKPQPRKPLTPEAKAWIVLRNDTGSLVQDIGAMTAQYQSLHVWYLKVCLEILRDPMTRDENREDIMVWMMEPPVKSKARAFSFQACLAAYDPRCDVIAAQAALLKVNGKVLSRRAQLLAERVLTKNKARHRTQ